MSLSKIEIGQRIRGARDAAGLTQADLAEKIGTRPGTISDWERGGVDQRIEGLAKIAEALGIKIGKLID